MIRGLSTLQAGLAWVAGGSAGIGLIAAAVAGFAVPWPILVFLVLATLGLGRLRLPLPLWVDGMLALIGTVALLVVLPLPGAAPSAYWMAMLATWLFAWLFAERLSAAMARGAFDRRFFGPLIPILFGAAIIVLWEAGTRAGKVPLVILPPPSAIWLKLIGSLPVLWGDFVQTFLRSTLIGYSIGCAAGFGVAILVDRSPFFKKGLLPLGNFVAALPIIGLAPILVLWFGPDWPSKAAVAVVLVFFPMLVNTVAGLNVASVIERDLMRTYASSYWQSLFKLRLPAAAPFIFNALKINSTLALIGAIVAEFFGTPTMGMGFRINTEVGRLNVDMVWAAITVAAVAGTAFYGLIALVERAVTFWHPSVRGG